jgi:transposase
LDVSDKSTHLCAVDQDGIIVWGGVCATDPETIAQTIARHCGEVARVVLETGALSSFLYHGLVERGVPAVCICARHARGVLSVRANKSDPHDSEGLAQLARTMSRCGCRPDIRSHSGGMADLLMVQGRAYQGQ